jgi:hypothetical protein
LQEKRKIRRRKEKEEKEKTLRLTPFISAYFDSSLILSEPKNFEPLIPITSVCIIDVYHQPHLGSHSKRGTPGQPQAH